MYEKNKYSIYAVFFIDVDDITISCCYFCVAFLATMIIVIIIICSLVVVFCVLSVFRGLRWGTSVCESMHRERTMFCLLV